MLHIPHNVTEMPSPRTAEQSSLRAGNFDKIASRTEQVGGGIGRLHAAAAAAAHGRHGMMNVQAVA